MPAKKSSHLVTALVVDAVLVALFSVIGHYTHSGNLDPAGLVSTAWPFFAGLIAAWILGSVWSAPLAPLRTGTGIWAMTVLIGLVIRVVTGQGTAGAFIVVATLFNLATLVGWRCIATAVAGRSK